MPRIFTTGKSTDPSVVLEIVVQLTSEDWRRGELGAEGDFKRMMGHVIEGLQTKLVEDLYPTMRQQFLDSHVTPEAINEAVRKAITDRIADLLLPRK